MERNNYSGHQKHYLFRAGCHGHVVPTLRHLWIQCNGKEPVFASKPLPARTKAGAKRASTVLRNDA